MIHVDTDRWFFYRKLLSNEATVRYMAVIIRFFASLRQAAGCDSVESHATTVARAVHELEKQFSTRPDFQRLLGISNVILNGTNVIFLKGPRTKLQDGDELTLFPPLGGG